MDKKILNELISKRKEYQKIMNKKYKNYYFMMKKEERLKKIKKLLNEIK